MFDMDELTQVGCTSVVNAVQVPSQTSNDSELHLSQLKSDDERESLTVTSISELDCKELSKIIQKNISVDVASMENFPNVD